MYAAVDAGSKPSRPLVSVIIPTRRRIDLVTRAVSSVLRQSEENFELIVVDDASDDGTAERLVELSKTDARIHLLRNATPQGAPGARNRGIAASRGEWIAFLDDDDEWMSTKLERQLERLKADTSAVACTCSYLALSSSGASRLVHVPDSVTLPRLLAYNCLGSASGCLCSGSVVRDIGGFDLEFKSAQDFDLWVQLRQRGNIVACTEALVVHRAHERPRITSSMHAQYLGARHFYFKYRGVMNPALRRHRLSVVCYMMSRQTTRALSRRARYLMLSVRNPYPRYSIAHLRSGLPRLLADAVRAWLALLYRKPARLE
jgi:glycosyltransferase involved in cell wall biosynthesis